MAQLKYEAGCYLAFVLSGEARSELLKLFPPSFEKVICHHVTIAFNNLDQKLFDDIIKVIGEDPKVVATGYYMGHNIDCFTVTVNGAKMLGLNSQNYHVTHSLQSPAKPVDSNKLIKSDEPSRLVNVELTGKLQMVRK